MAGAFVLDRASILERLGGDDSIYDMMVDMFLEDVENNCAALQAALAEGDMAALQREVHTIKGLLATFSDVEGTEEAQQTERQLKEGNTDGVAEAVAAVESRLREVAGVLSAAR